MPTPTLGADVPIFRIDAFDVPLAALPAFLERIERLRRLLDAQPGCVQNQTLTRASGPGCFNVITIVQWIDGEAMERATKAMQLAFAREGFDPAVFMEHLGVRADRGLYHARLVRA